MLDSFDQRRESSEKVCDALQDPCQSTSTNIYAHPYLMLWRCAPHTSEFGDSLEKNESPAVADCTRRQYATQMIDWSGRTIDRKESST
jgi:hypothetical protein